MYVKIYKRGVNMKCYLNNLEQVVEVSKTLENKINNVISKYHIYTSSSYGLEANNDGGIDDVKYSYKYYELQSENFVVDGKNIIAYLFEKYQVPFDGTNEVEIYDIDNTDYSGWNNVVDREKAKIIKK